MAKPGPSRLRPLTLRLLNAPVHALKRVHCRRSLRIRTLVAMVKARPSRPRPLILRLLNAPVHAL
ncbi:hypothetical protein BVJ53_03100 [Lacticaseibacillus chiayiensis]|uniref:Uncharacterized protein n=1 Tax=Lacticaseibacillus chiayiensis TaxID=2100821 RepID=A0A4Q1UF58_9LACO|nr:hypothetical protein BVJ53_03100 [Lacticaseibacillus chiayiensis]